jgi:hypothetical protein
VPSKQAWDSNTGQRGYAIQNMTQIINLFMDSPWVKKNPLKDTKDAASVIQSHSEK